MRGKPPDLRRRLESMSDKEFVVAWKRVFGQPPAAIVDRTTMIELLLADGPDRIRSKEQAVERVRAAIREEARSRL